MKKLFIFLFIFLLNTSLAGAEHIPKSIAGFTLGDPLSKYLDKIVSGSTQCIRYQDYLNEVEIVDIEGFKAGLLCVGNCFDPDKVIRIKLKYSNSSKKFYDTLLKRYKKEYGKPDQWKGDAFGVVLAWKWSFTEHNGDKISLTLQHNAEDKEMKMGNSVKLTMTSAMEREKACYEAQEKRGLETKRDKFRQEKRGKGKPDWDMFIPK